MSNFTPTPADLQLADNIRFLCGKKSRSKTTPMTLKAIGEAAKLSAPMLWGLQNAKRPVNEDQILRLAKATDYEPWRFLVGVEGAVLRFPNIDLTKLRKKPMYSRIEGPMRSDKELARFFGGMSKETLAWLKPTMEKVVEYVQTQRKLDIDAGRYERRSPIY